MTEILTLAWADMDSVTVSRGTSARTAWTVAGVLEETAADALRTAVRQALDHQPIQGARGRAAVADRIVQTIETLCHAQALELLAVQVELESGVCVIWQRSARGA